MQAILASAGAVEQTFTSGIKYTILSRYTKEGLPEYSSEIRFDSIAFNLEEGVIQATHPLQSYTKIQAPSDAVEKIRKMQAKNYKSALCKRK